MHMDASERVLANIREALARDFHITHTTIQFERPDFRRMPACTCPPQRAVASNSLYAVLS